MASLRPRAWLALAVVASCDAGAKPPPPGDRVIEAHRAHDEQTCDRLVAPFRAALLPGLERSVADKVVVGGVTCVFTPAGADPKHVILGGEGVYISLLCAPGLTEGSSLDTVVAPYRDGAPIAGLGKRAVGDNRELRFWDRDCAVLLISVTGRHLLELAHAVDARLLEDPTIATPADDAAAVH